MRRVKKLLINASRSKKTIFFYLAGILILFMLLISNISFIKLIVCWSVILFFNALIEAFKNIDEQTAYNNSLIKILLSCYEFILYIHELALAIIFYLSFGDINHPIINSSFILLMIAVILCLILVVIISARISDYFKTKLKRVS